MGIYQCKGGCSNFEKKSRQVDGISICDPCNYATITDDIYCPCCKRKFRVRKRGNNANYKRLADEKRM